MRWAARLEARLASLSEQEYAAFVATVQTTYEARKASDAARARGEPLAAPEAEEDDRSLAVSEKSLATAATAPSRARSRSPTTTERVRDGHARPVRPSRGAQSTATATPVAAPSERPAVAHHAGRRGTNRSPPRRRREPPGDVAADDEPSRPRSRFEASRTGGGARPVPEPIDVEEEPAPTEAEPEAPTTPATARR